MKGITWLIASSIIYLTAALVLPYNIVYIQMAWLFVTSLPLWIPPFKQWMFK